MPIGLYRILPENHLAGTGLAVLMPPEPIAKFLADRNYLPRGVPLLKQVLALPGQTVCRIRLAVMIDGVVMATARERDHRGRPLPVWQGRHMNAEVVLREPGERTTSSSAFIKASPGKDGSGLPLISY